VLQIVIFSFARTFDKSSKPEIAHFDIHIVVEEKISEVLGPVDHLMCVHIEVDTDELHH